MLEKEMYIAEMTEKVTENAADILTACRAYMLATAHEQTIKEMTEEIQNRVLSENCYMPEQKYIDQLNEAGKKHGRVWKTERITREFDSYMMNETDFQDYIGKCYAYYVEAGIADKRGKNYFPYAEPHDLRLKAENLLLDELRKILPSCISIDDFDMMRKHWKYREKLIDLALDMQRLEGVKEV